MLLRQFYFLFALAFQKFSSYTSQMFHKKFFHTCILHTAYTFGLGFLQCFKHYGFETFLRYINICIKCLHSIQNILFEKCTFPLSKNKIEYFVRGVLLIFEWQGSQCTMYNVVQRQKTYQYDVN